MPATLTYNPSPLQNPAGILRADSCDPWRHSTVPSTASHPRGFMKPAPPFPIGLLPLPGLAISVPGQLLTPHCSLLNTRCSLSEAHALKKETPEKGVSFCLITQDCTISAHPSLSAGSRHRRTCR